MNNDPAAIAAELAEISDQIRKTTDALRLRAERAGQRWGEDGVNGASKAAYLRNTELTFARDAEIAAAILDMSSKFSNLPIEPESKLRNED